MRRTQSHIIEELKSRGISGIKDSQELALWGIVFALEDLTEIHVTSLKGGGT